MSEMQDEQVLLEVKELRKHFPIRKGFLQRVVGQVRAVDGIDFSVNRGETFGLVGESGCGKTTASRCIVRALQPSDGEVHFRTDDGAMVDIANLSRDELQPLRRQMQMIFQDPFSSLNPRMTLFDIIGEPLLVNGVTNRQQRINRVEELLGLVGLRPEFLQRFPHAFSGGQRQRIGIARALALSPSLVVADEPVSALDVSVQAQILNLMLELQNRLGLTYLFVAHDLSVVKHICDRVARSCTSAASSRRRRPRSCSSRPNIPTLKRSSPPCHSPTRACARSESSSKVRVADPSNPPSGCYFHPRCRYAEDICREETPALEEISPGHAVSCHRAHELQLTGTLDAQISPAGHP